MSVRVILHAVMLVLNNGARTDFPPSNFQDLFLQSVFLVGLQTVGLPVTHVFPVEEKNSLPKCGNDFMTFLTSSNYDLDSTNSERTYEEFKKDKTSVEDKKRSIKREEIVWLSQQKNVRRLNTRILTGLVVLRSHMNTKPANSITTDEGKVNTKYPLTVINVHVSQPVDLKQFPKDIFTPKRPTRSLVPENNHKTYNDGFASIPWKALWILQEFRALKVPSKNLYKRSIGSKGEEEKASTHVVKKRSEDHHDLAVVPWQALWLLQSERTECNFPGKVLRVGSSTKDIEMNDEWLRPNPEESLGNCPVRFRPLVDPYRWMPRNLVETECVCEGSPCAQRGMHVCVTVYATRTAYSLRAGKRRILIAVGCLCAIQKTRLANSITPKTVD